MNGICKKTVAVILTVCMLCTCMSGSVSALTADETWRSYYEKHMEDGYAVYMNPGSNETQRNFSWYAPLTAQKACVDVSTDSSFADCGTFYGTFLLTPEGDRAEKITVSGLDYETTYYYRCRNGENVIREASFTTSSENGFTAVYMTDIHISREEDETEEPLVHESYTFSDVLADAREQTDYELILSAGDQASYGDRREYASLVASPTFQSVPIALTVGNHDRKGIAYKYFNNNPNRYSRGVSSLIGNDYWFVKGDVLFLVFDSNNTAAITHRNFVRDAVESNPDVKWKVAVMHHDLYGRLTEGRLEDADENRRPVFVPIFDEFGVDLVLLGHSHYYSVSNAMYDGNTVGTWDENNSITDAEGTVYMVSNSVNHPRSVQNAESIIPTDANAVAVQKEGLVYNIIDFSEEAIVVKSYVTDEKEPFHSFSIYKTDKDGGHLDYAGSPNLQPNRFLLEFLAFWTEFGEGIAAIWKNYFDR